MSKKPTKASGRAQEATAGGRVFDFLYYDAARIGSFASQLDDSGLLQSVTQADQSGRSRRPGTSVRASMSLPGLGFPGESGPEAGLTLSRDAQEVASRSNERTYDPMWINAINFKEYLEAERRLVEDLTKAAMGQFVLLKGRLSVMDASVLKLLWSDPEVQKRWVRNAAAQKAAEKAIGTVDKKAGETPVGNTRLVFDLMAALPHGIHCLINTGELEAWGPLRTEGMVSRVGDVMLIHGTEVSGDWQMIAIMDARPNTQEEIDDQVTAVTDAPVEGLRRAIGGLGRMARKLLGRPAGVYGVTPLLIYREITGF